MKLRKAIPDDAKAFMHIKSQLSFTTTDGSTSSGGFLLGTDKATYVDYIDTSYCLVAEENDVVIGFGIIFPDDVLRASDVWIRRHTASWNIDLPQYEPQQLCYFEQFAFLRGHKRSAVTLAYNIAKWAFDSGNETMFATTVSKPVLNLAAIPFINAADGIKAGNINETYPLIGNINSDIYMLDAPTFYRKVQEHPLYSYVQANTINL